VGVVREEAAREPEPRAIVALAGLFHSQALLFGGGVFVPSNYVPLRF
jgi:hypothetical protein